MCEECGKWFPRTEMFPYINIFGENTKAYLCPNCYKIRKEKIEFGITVKRMKELENDIRNNGAWNIVSSFIHKHIDYFNGDEKSSKLYKSERKKLSNLLKQKYNINTELDDDSILYGNEFSNFMFEVAKRPEFMQKKQKKDFEELETFEREILSQDIRTEDFKESKTILRSVSPNDFEKIVADVFKSQGYTKIKKTPSTSDYGADIVMEDDEGRVYVVEVKKYADKNLIGRPLLQKLQGACDYYKATGMKFVTLGFFTSNAKNYAKEFNIHLINGDEFISMFNDYKKKDSDK